MVTYLLACSGTDLATAKKLVSVDFDAVQLLENMWLILTEADIESLNEELALLLGNPEKLVLLEVAGDFSLAGMNEKTMQWVASNLEMDDEEE